MYIVKTCMYTISELVLNGINGVLNMLIAHNFMLSF